MIRRWTRHWVNPITSSYIWYGQLSGIRLSSRILSMTWILKKHAILNQSAYMLSWSVRYWVIFWIVSNIIINKDGVHLCAVFKSISDWIKFGVNLGRIFWYYDKLSLNYLLIVRYHGRSVWIIDTFSFPLASIRYVTTCEPISKNSSVL